jgi:hypothetical protein
MIAGYHLIWTAYGTWLPNDPRGSTSTSVRNEAIAGLGDLHYGRKRIQPAGKIIHEFYDAASAVLKHELRTISEAESILIGESFGSVIRQRNYTCYACAVMPDHIHNSYLDSQTSRPGRRDDRALSSSQPRSCT